MASSLPTPGQLVLENISLLSSTETSFQERYNFTLGANTFVKQGNTLEANSVLHFLLCHIEPEHNDPSFKPCWPIRDREQERDFRRVVDSRLAVLEKSKLLPVGAARKSVVASAGGDRFLDLLWSLSSLALQQACLRSPPYGPVSRMRLMSQQNLQTTSSNLSSQSLSQSPSQTQLQLQHQRSSDSLSYQGSARSNRSLLSAVSNSRSERYYNSNDSQQQHSSLSSNQQSNRSGRRFLGVGILSASQQRTKDAEQLRARIDAERNALERTTDLAKKGATTWASEAESLRDKIGYFEAKLTRLKDQLTDMGFDENGNDIRGHIISNTNNPEEENGMIVGSGSSGSRSVVPSTANVGIPTSISRDNLDTSPVDSTESGSSVDELPEPNEMVGDLAADLTRVRTFSSETCELRDRVDRSLQNDNSNKLNLELDHFQHHHGGNSNRAEAADIVDLVRAATTELEEATNRMDAIREESRRAGKDVPDLDYNDDKGGVLQHSLSGGEKSSSNDTETSISLVSVPDDSEIKEEPKLVTSSTRSLATSPANDADCEGGAEEEEVEETKHEQEQTQSPNLGSEVSSVIKTEPQPLLPKQEEIEMSEKLIQNASPIVSTDNFKTDVLQADNSPTVEVANETKVSKGDDVTEQPINKSSTAAASNETEALKEVATDALERHTSVVEAFGTLKQEANTLSKEATSEAAKISEKKLTAPQLQRSASVSMDVQMLSSAIMDIPSNRDEDAATDSEVPMMAVNTVNDLQSAAKAIRSYSGTMDNDRKHRSSVTAIRRKKNLATRSLDSININPPSDRTVDLSPRYDTDVTCNMPVMTQGSKSVRFADLPPSYSRTRGGAAVGGHSRHSRVSRHAAELHPRSPRSSQKSTKMVGIDGAAVPNGSPGNVSNAKRVLQNASNDVNSSFVNSTSSHAGGHAKRSVPVSGQKPPRLERKQTPHRIVRPKEVLQRSVTPSSNTQKKANRPLPSRNSMVDVTSRSVEGSPKTSRQRSESVEDISKLAKQVDVVLPPSIVQNGRTDESPRKSRSRSSTPNRTNNNSRASSKENSPIRTTATDKIRISPSTPTATAVKVITRPTSVSIPVSLSKHPMSSSTSSSSTAVSSSTATSSSATSDVSTPVTSSPPSRAVVSSDSTENKVATASSIDSTTEKSIPSISVSNPIAASTSTTSITSTSISTNPTVVEAAETSPNSTLASPLGTLENEVYNAINPSSEEEVVSSRHSASSCHSPPSSPKRSSVKDVAAVIESLILTEDRSMTQKAPSDTNANRQKETIQPDSLVNASMINSALNESEVRKDVDEIIGKATTESNSRAMLQEGGRRNVEVYLKDTVSTGEKPIITRDAKQQLLDNSPSDKRGLSNTVFSDDSKELEDSHGDGMSRLDTESIIDNMSSFDASDNQSTATALTNSAIAGVSTTSQTRGPTQRNGGHRPAGKLFGKNSLLRISGVGLLGGMGSKGRSLSMSSRESQDANKDNSISGVSMDNSDLMKGSYSVGSRINSNMQRNSGSNGNGASNGRGSGGFFAGETAHWQENCRGQGSNDNIQSNSNINSSNDNTNSNSNDGSEAPSLTRADTSIRHVSEAEKSNRASSSSIINNAISVSHHHNRSPHQQKQQHNGGNSGNRFGRGNGRHSGGSGGTPIRNCVQSLRARLAALTKD